MRAEAPEGYAGCVTTRRSNPAEAVPEDARRARVLPQVDRSMRIGAMLDRWEAEDVADEPDWDVNDVAPLALRQTRRKTAARYRVLGQTHRGNE